MDVEQRARTLLADEFARMGGVSAKYVEEVRKGIVGPWDRVAIGAIIAALTPPEGDMGNPISVPDGFVLVPVDPTEKMQRAGAGITCTNVDEAWEVWHAMLAARPEVKE